MQLPKNLPKKSNNQTTTRKLVEVTFIEHFHGHLEKSTGVVLVARHLKALTLHLIFFIINSENYSWVGKCPNWQSQFVKNP